MATTSNVHMVAAAPSDLFGSCWAGKQESSPSGGCGASANGMVWATSKGRKKLAGMQSSRAGGGARAAAAGGGSQAHFRQLNKRIIDAADSEDILALLWVIKCNLADMNLVNLATSIHRLAKTFVAVEVQTQCLLVSNEVVKDLLATIQSKLTQATVDSTLTQILNNVAWSIATMQIKDAHVLTSVAELAFKVVDRFKPYELSTLVWAFAKLYGDHSLPPSAKRLFFAVATQVSKDLQSFSFRSLANIVWAYATTGVHHSQLFRIIAGEMIHSADSANCQGIANAIWAFSIAGHGDMKLFDVLTEAALPIINDFKAQELLSMLWGLAISGFVKESVFIVALKAVRVMELSPQQLANIFWACATVLPNHSMTQAAAVDLLPRVSDKFMAFKLLELASVMQALAKVAAVDGEDTTMLNGALLLPRSVYQSIYAFLRFATPWFEEHLCELQNQIFTSVVCVYELFGLAQNGNHLGQMLEQQVIDRVDSLQCEQILQLLRALLSSRATCQAVCVLAGNLAGNFRGLRANQRWQLQQLAVAAFHQAGLQFLPDEEMLYSWCLTLAVTKPDLARGLICEAWSGDEDEGPSSGAKGVADGSPELLELQDSSGTRVDAKDGNSTLGPEPGEFSYDCQLGSVDSLPNFPNTPEDSDDEYYMALVVQQANKVCSMSSSGGESFNLNLGTPPARCWHDASGRAAIS